ncbi:MAG TPA: FCD domain-containing protein, partial [Arthrobacter sp.]
GSFALTPPADRPSESVGIRPVATTEDRLHLLAFRMGVETEAAALAARNRSERQLRAVNTALDTFTESSGHPARAMKADFEFHRAVAAASGNPYYSDCLAALGQTMIAMPRTRLMTGAEHYARDHFDQVVLEHRSIRDAIADGDDAAAAAAMRTHLANSRRRFKASARPPA